MTDHRQPVLIIGAVAPELAHIVAEIGSPIQSVIGKRNMTRGSLSDVPVAVLETGPGVVNTAQSLAAFLEHTKPSLIIQTGCAGVFRESGGRIGDIGLAQCEIDVHTGIESSGDSPFIPDPLPFALLKTGTADCMNTFPIDPEKENAAFRILKEAFHETDTRVLRGPFITVSTITASDNRADAYYRTYFPVMESMEGSAAAHIACLYSVPFIEVRAASNCVGNRDKSGWDLPLSFSQCAKAVLYLMNHIDKIVKV